MQFTSLLVRMLTIDTRLHCLHICNTIGNAKSKIGTKCIRGVYILILKKIGLSELMLSLNQFYVFD